MYVRMYVYIHIYIYVFIYIYIYICMMLLLDVLIIYNLIKEGLRDSRTRARRLSVSFRDLRRGGLAEILNQPFSDKQKPAPAHATTHPR